MFKIIFLTYPKPFYQIKWLIRLIELQCRWFNDPILQEYLCIFERNEWKINSSICVGFKKFDRRMVLVARDKYVYFSEISQANICERWQILLNVSHSCSSCCFGILMLRGNHITRKIILNMFLSSLSWKYRFQFPSRLLDFPKYIEFQEFCALMSSNWCTGE